MPGKKLADRLRDATRLRGYAIRTEEAYLHGYERFVPFHKLRHPATMGAPEIEAFLTHLAAHESEGHHHRHPGRRHRPNALPPIPCVPPSPIGSKRRITSSTISKNSGGMLTSAPPSITLQARDLPTNGYAVSYLPGPEATLWLETG